MKIDIEQGSKHAKKHYEAYRQTNIIMFEKYQLFKSISTHTQGERQKLTKKDTLKLAKKKNNIKNNVTVPSAVAPVSQHTYIKVLSVLFLKCMCSLIVDSHFGCKVKLKFSPCFEINKLKFIL